MYNLVYEAMEVAGVTRRLEIPEWQDATGKRVESEREAV